MGYFEKPQFHTKHIMGKPCINFWLLRSDILLDYFTKSADAIANADFDNHLNS